jgi:ATP-dependent DNA ligase
LDAPLPTDRRCACGPLGADLILDGEVVVADSRGIPDFGLLHADLAVGRQDRLLYYAFDLLYLDGFDLRAARLIERKRLFSELLAARRTASSTPSTWKETAPKFISAPA